MRTQVKKHFSTIFYYTTFCICLAMWCKFKLNRIWTFNFLKFADFTLNFWISIERKLNIITPTTNIHSLVKGFFCSINCYDCGEIILKLKMLFGRCSPNCLVAGLMMNNKIALKKRKIFKFVCDSFWPRLPDSIIVYENMISSIF